jgi:hypothetical protein
MICITTTVFASSALDCAINQYQLPRPDINLIGASVGSILRFFAS